MTTCLIDTCISPARTRGLCNAHYLRIWRKRDLLPTQTLKERLYSRIDISGGPDACHEWTGYRMPKTGYGQINRGKRGEGIVLVHRLAFELEYGREPIGLLRHKVCDNPPCCNLHHLEEGTDADNAADKMAHNRQRRGEGVPNAKLRSADIPRIRELLALGVPAAKIGRDYGVVGRTVRDIRDGITWQHV